jgi:hypothetical protein
MCLKICLSLKGLLKRVTLNSTNVECIGYTGETCIILPNQTAKSDIIIYLALVYSIYLMKQLRQTCIISGLWLGCIDIAVTIDLFLVVFRTMQNPIMRNCSHIP